VVLWLLWSGFEGELAEACAPSNYNIGLLAYGVLAGAVKWWHW
jgi:hypothetical protein